MEHLVVTVIVAFVVIVLMQFRIRRACRINPAIAAWRPVIIGISLLWGIVFVVRVHYLADVPGARADSIYHEFRAHEIAEMLRSGDLSSALAMGGVGNYGFDFIVGVIYAITHAPEPAVMGLFTLMAFSGLLTLLDIISRATHATQLPFWVVLVVCAYPEAMFWSTDTLKEGPVLWGACVMLRFIVPDPTKRGIRRWLLPFAGTMVFMFLRPHIAFAWLVAIGMAQVIKQRRWRMAFVITAGICGSALLMIALAPKFFSAIAQRGILETLEGSVRSMEHDVGGSNISYEGESPIPFVTGASLLFLRPFPWEAPNWIGFLLGSEALFLTFVMVVSWLNLSNWRKHLFSPLMLTVLLVTVFLAFAFSYIPNLGLVVRQRMQFFPAMIALAATPGLIRHSMQYKQPHKSGVPMPPYRVPAAYQKQALQPQMSGLTLRPVPVLRRKPPAK